MSAVENLTALDHLTLDAMSDWDIFTQLTTSNAHLITENSKMADAQKILNEHLRTALSTIKQTTEAVEEKPGGGYDWVGDIRGGGRGRGRPQDYM